MIIVFSNSESSSV